MQQSAIRFTDKLKLIHEHWAPHVVAEMNNYQFKLAKLLGEFVWHQHDDTDETFVVIEGSMEIELPGQTVTVDQGEMFVVPKGMQHRPVAREPCHVLLIEPQGVTNTGDVGGELTAPNDVWI